MPTFEPLKAKLITPARVMYEGEVRSLVAPAVGGMLGVMGGHAPMMAALDYGVLKLASGSDEKYFAVSGGFLQVVENSVVVLADKAYAGEDIDRADQDDRLARLENELSGELERGEKRRLEKERAEVRAMIDAADRQRES